MFSDAEMRRRRVAFGAELERNGVTHAAVLGVTVSATAELIGGNYTNLTSDIAASIAAGAPCTWYTRTTSAAR